MMEERDPITDIHVTDYFRAQWRRMLMPEHLIDELAFTLYVEFVEELPPRTPDGMFWVSRPAPRHPDSRFFGESIHVCCRLDGTVLVLDQVMTQRPWQD